MHSQLRLMLGTDLAAVYAIQTEAYDRAMVESVSVLASRLQTSPGTVWVAEDTRGICAYLFAYPSTCGKITRLGAPFLIPSEPDSLYLHDLAVAPRAAGRGIGVSLVRYALDSIRGLRYSSLVSVQSTRGFWSGLGYTEQTQLTQEQQACRSSYVGPAFYFIKELS